MKALRILILYQLLRLEKALAVNGSKKNAKLQFFQQRLKVVKNENVVQENLYRTNHDENTLDDNVKIEKSMSKEQKCKHETQQLSLSELNSYIEPYWFYYLGQEMGNDGKDWTSFFNCTNTEDEFKCDYEKFGMAIKGNCEEKDGELYNVQVNISCSNGYTSYDQNLPMCIGKSCDIDEKYFQNSVDFQLCPYETEELVTKVTKEKKLISNECSEQKVAFTKASGFGDPNFVFEEGFDFDKYCSSTEAPDGSVLEICDFMSEVKKLKSSCNAQGGILYKFSDKVTYTKGFYGGGNLESRYLNIPLCLGTTCFAKSYFENIIVPSMKFYFDGDYNRNATYWYTSNYTMLGYTPVLDQENPYGKFFLNMSKRKGIQVPRIKTCKWLAKRSQKAKERLCTKRRYQKTVNDVGPASNICVETCAPFCRLEKPNSKFLYSIGDDGLVATRHCKWLTNQEPDIISKVCSSFIDVKESIYAQASDTCTTTCGTCEKRAR